MNNPGTAFEVIAELLQQITFLNKIILGNKTDTVNINGVIKPSITKAIADAIPFNSTTLTTSIDFVGEYCRRNGVDIATVDQLFKYWGTTFHGQNLNNFDVSRAGVHSLPANAYANHANNYPLNFGGALVVIPSLSNQNRSFTQIYYPYNSNESYRRNYVSAGTSTGSWTNWVRMINAENIAEYLPDAESGGITKYRQVFTENAIFNRPAGVNTIYISGCGGAAGGSGRSGGSNSVIANSTITIDGRMGGWIWKYALTLDVTDTEFEISIGAGGPSHRRYNASDGGGNVAGSASKIVSANNNIIFNGGPAPYFKDSVYTANTNGTYVTHNGKKISSTVLQRSNPMFPGLMGGAGQPSRNEYSEPGHPGIIILEW